MEEDSFLTGPCFVTKNIYSPLADQRALFSAQLFSFYAVFENKMPNAKLVSAWEKLNPLLSEREKTEVDTSQWRIQDFPEVGHQPSGGGANIRFYPNFPQNRMKLKEFGPQGRWRSSLAPPPWSATANQSVFCRVLDLFSKSANLWNKWFSWPVCEKLSRHNSV